VRLTDRQITRTTRTIEMSLKCKDKGEPRRDHDPGIPTSDHPLPLTILDEIGGKLQLIPGSR